MIPVEIKPLFNHILVTMEKEVEDKKIGSLIDVTHKEGSIKDIQKVVAVGNTVTTLAVGDDVHINPTRYIRTKHSLKDDLDSGTDMQVNVQFPVVNVGGIDYLFLFDSDIDYKITKWGPNPSTELYTEKTEIIN